AGVYAGVQAPRPPSNLAPGDSDARERRGANGGTRARAAERVPGTAVESRLHDRGVSDGECATRREIGDERQAGDIRFRRWLACSFANAVHDEVAVVTRRWR